MFPTPFTVQRHVHVAGTDGRYGNSTDTWPTTVDVAVHGWAPGGAEQEPNGEGRTPVVRDLDLYCPAGTVFAPMDRATVDGLLYEVVGNPEDFTHGPFGWAAGVRIHLNRVEG